MKRRDFITLLGGAAAWPLVLLAQQPTVPVIGFLGSTSAEGYVPFVAAFRQGLKEGGYTEGQNVAIEYRWAGDRYDRLPALAADLVQRRVAVIAAASGPSTRAAKAATSTIPIVFSTGVDPVETGLVASLNRPGGNLTGVTNVSIEIVGKRLELFRQLLPAAKVVAVLTNATQPALETQVKYLEAAARILDLRLDFLNAATEGELDLAFTSVAERRADALLVTDDPFFVGRRDQIVALAARNAVPAIYTFRDFTAAGGLMSYAASLVDMYRQIGLYTARILKGEKPADLPVMQPTKFELVINLKTARALGLTVPTLRAIADEVIE